jgi:hypothetical protein
MVAPPFCMDAPPFCMDAPPFNIVSPPFSMARYRSTTATSRRRLSSVNVVTATGLEETSFFAFLGKSSTGVRRLPVRLTGPANEPVEC